jgi:hypothetical protein
VREPCEDPKCRAGLTRPARPVDDPRVTVVRQHPILTTLAVLLAVVVVGFVLSYALSSSGVSHG